MHITSSRTFTAMMYAIVKNVVSPARSSVVNFVFLISFSYMSSQYSDTERFHSMATNMSRPLETEDAPEC